MAHGYLYGIYSSRKREEACQYRLDFKCLAEDLFYQFGKKREEMNETDHQTVYIATAAWSICNRRMVPLRVPAARHAAGQKNQPAQGSCFAKNLLGKARTGDTQYFIRARHSSASAPLYSGRRRVCASQKRFWVSRFLTRRLISKAMDKTGTQPAQNACVFPNAFAVDAQLKSYPHAGLFFDSPGFLYLHSLLAGCFLTLRRHFSLDWFAKWACRGSCFLQRALMCVCTLKMIQVTIYRLRYSA